MTRTFINRNIRLIIAGVFLLTVVCLAFTITEFKSYAQFEESSPVSISQISTNAPAQVLANDGDLDTTFNWGSDDQIDAIVIQRDGKIITGGRGGGNIAGRVRRLNTDGSLDTTFNPGSGASQEIKTVAIQSDGKILIGGYFTTFNGVSRNGIARLNTDGSLDTTFNLISGFSHIDIREIAIQNDGKILIGGLFSTIQGNYITTINIARLNSDGSLDTTFHSRTVSENNYVYKIAIQIDGKILINGTGVIRLNTDGSYDTTFSIGSVGGSGGISIIVVQKDGRIVFGGDFTKYNGVSRNGIARLNTDGSLDTTFNTSSIFHSVSRIAIQNDGKIIVGGTYLTNNTYVINLVARLLNSCCSTITISPSTVAANQTTNLVVNGSNFQNNFTASVTTPDGTFSIAAAGLTFVNSSQVRVQVNISGTAPYTATLRITNPDNQSAIGQFQVVSTTNPPPVINSISPSQIPANQTRTLTVYGSNFQPGLSVHSTSIVPPKLTYISSSEVQVQVTMGGNPPYLTSLALNNPDGQTAAKIFSVSNTPPNSNSPTASFTFAPANPNVNQAVQFTSTSTGQSLSYAWDFESDGKIDSTSANPTPTFTTPGPRNVTLSVTNSYGSSTATNIVRVGTTDTSAPFITDILQPIQGSIF